MAVWLLKYRWERRPPRKIRTAYAYFVKDHYRRIRQQLGTKNPQPIFRSIGQMWRNMGPEERLPYRKQELNDRRRYAESKTNWSRYFQGRLPRMRRRRKQRDAPVRTRNPFIIFERENWGSVKAEHEDYTQQEIMQELGRRWNAMTDEQKEPYRKMSSVDKKRYFDEVMEYRRQKWQLEAERKAEKYENRLVELRRIHAARKSKITLQARG